MIVTEAETVISPS